MEFDTLLQISLIVETLFFVNTCSIERLTLHAHHVNIWQSLLGGKYFIKIFFRKPIKLTSDVGVRLMGQYKHTNINLTTDVGSD